jgi:hypothetical protein
MNEPPSQGLRPGGTALNATGTLDEFRLSTFEPNPNWVATDYNNQRSTPTPTRAQEPFCHDLPRSRIRYASVFQIGARP